jgi:antibiotic biosynthesis monooxygenase (ABM) superfamily enzyme
MAERGNALVMILGDVPAEHEAEYHRWYDTAHIPVRLGLPGFLAAARYRLSEGEARFLTLYELQDSGALRSPEMKAAMEHPSDWDRKMAAVTQVKGQAGYKRLRALGATSGPHGEWLMTVGLSVKPEAEEDFNQWYDTEHLPQLAAVAGVLGARRYRRSFGDSPQYLAIYEFSAPEIRTGPAWAAAAYTGWTRRMQANFLDRRLNFGQRLLSLAAKSADNSVA